MHASGPVRSNLPPVTYILYLISLFHSQSYWLRSNCTNTLQYFSGNNCLARFQMRDGQKNAEPLLLGPDSGQLQDGGQAVERPVELSPD